MSPLQSPSQENRDTSDLEKGKNGQTTTDVHREKSRSTRKLSSLLPSQAESNFGDSSGPIFSLYSKTAKEEDDGKVERWQKEADGILIFTGLFSASVAALLAVTVQDLRPNAQDTSAFYLGNIYQILADPNATVSHTPIPYPVVKPPPFSPPGYAVLVNSLWFLSLVISLTCALLATSLQQWARRYARVSQPARCSPEKRARLRAFFARGVDKMHLPWAVEAVPVLLHASLFLFFAGLVTFLLNVNHCVYFSVIWWIGLFSMLYGCITFMPIFRPDSPYYTPLSPPVSFISYLVLLAIVMAIDVLRRCAIIVAALHSILRRRFDVARTVIRSCTGRIRYHNPRDREYSEDEGNSSTPVAAHFFKRTTEVLEHQAELIKDSRTAAEEITLEQSSEIDLNILDWAIGALGEDEDLEKFFGAIPGFFKSQMVKGLRENLSNKFCSKFAESWGGFLARSLLYNSVSEETKNRRLAICMNAITNICDANDWSKTFCDLSTLRFDQIPPSIQAAQMLVPWFQSRDGPTNPTSELARYTVAKMLPYVRNRDDHWIALASDVYGLPKQILSDHIAQDDNSVLLAIFIHAARQVIDTEPWKWEMLSSISKFDIKKTTHGLQIEFCALWNEIAGKANDESVDTGSNLANILDGIHHLYLDLHPGTDATLTYVGVCDSFLLCQDVDHCPIDSPPTHHRDSYHAMTYRSRSKSPLTHGCNTDLQQAEEANFTPTPTPPAHAPPHPQLSLSSAHPPFNSGKQDSDEKRDNEDIAVPHSASGVTPMPSADNQIPQVISNICPTLQTSEGATGTSLISVSDSLRSPSMIPAPRSGSTPEGVPSDSPVESALVQPHRISLPPRSSPATVHPDNSSDGTHSILMVDPRHEIRSVSSTPDIVGHTSAHRGRQDCCHADGYL